MMDYSVYAYIQRLSTEKLKGFLLNYEKNGETEKYGYIIPYILAELEKREKGNDT